MRNIDSNTLQKAIDRASKQLGCDPAYYGKEGEEEIKRQIKLLNKGEVEQ